jgi:hypothetical protein
MKEYERKNESMWEVKALSSLPSNKYYFIHNLRPNNKPRNAQISHYWPQDFLGSTLSLKQAWEKAPRWDISKDKGLGQGVNQVYIPTFVNVPNLWTSPIVKHKRKVIMNLNIFRSQGNICIYSFKVVRLRSFKSGKDLRGVLHQLLSIRSLPFLLSMHNTLLFKSSLTYCDSYWLVLGCARTFFFLRFLWKEPYWLAHQQSFWKIGHHFPIEAPIWTAICKNRNKCAP